MNYNSMHHLQMKKLCSLTYCFALKKHQSLISTCSISVSNNCNTKKIIPLTISVVQETLVLDLTDVQRQFHVQMNPLQLANNFKSICVPIKIFVAKN